MSKHLRAASAVGLVGWVTVAVLIMGAASCPRGGGMNLDSKFSVNLARPAPTWPEVKKLQPAELDAYEKYGKPDFFRIWYNERGDIMTSREAGPAIRGKLVSELQRSWIYERTKTELQFVSPTKYVEVPISDQVRVLCLRGDPQERDHQSLPNGSVRETWRYFDVGESYTFVDGRQDGKPQVFKGIGRPFMKM